MGFKNDFNMNQKYTIILYFEMIYISLYVLFKKINKELCHKPYLIKKVQLKTVEHKLLVQT